MDIRAAVNEALDECLEERERVRASWKAFDEAWSAFRLTVRAAMEDAAVVLRERASLDVTVTPSNGAESLTVMAEGLRIFTLQFKPVTSDLGYDMIECSSDPRLEAADIDEQLTESSFDKSVVGKKLVAFIRGVFAELNIR